jgi:hypothetical protein
MYSLMSMIVLNEKLSLVVEKEMMR